MCTTKSITKAGSLSCGVRSSAIYKRYVERVTKGCTMEIIGSFLGLSMAALFLYWVLKGEVKP